MDNELLVVGQGPHETHDNARLEPLIAAVQQHDPQTRDYQVLGVTADSGYYAGDAIGRFLATGIDLCVPDSNTAGDLHRDQPIGTVRAKQRGSVTFEYDAAADLYRCPEGNELRRRQERVMGGQQLKIYRAHADCRACPQANVCLSIAPCTWGNMPPRWKPPDNALPSRNNKRAIRRAALRSNRYSASSVGPWVTPVGCSAGCKESPAKAACLRPAYQFRKINMAWAEAAAS